MRPATLGLGHLVGSTSRFMERYWPDSFGHFRVGARVTDALNTFPSLRSVEALCRAFDGNVRVHSPRQEDRLDAFVPTNVASRFYDHGCTLLFERLEAQVPEFQQAAEQLANDLRVDKSSVYCDVFATRQRGSVAMHFDAGYQFNVQLRGTKRWYVAANASVTYPPTGYHSRFDVPNSLRELGFRPPRAFPSNHTSFIAKPGSVIWLPWGWWHRTEILPGADSFAVLFGFKPLTWASYVSKAIERQLSQKTEWRRAVFQGGHAKHPERRLEIEHMLKELSEHVRSLTFADVAYAALPHYLGPRNVFRSNATGTKVLSQGKRTKVSALNIYRRDGTQVAFEVDSPPVMRLVRWVVSRRTPFIGAEAMDVAHPLAPEKVANALRLLVRAGLLTMSTEHTPG